jgi:transcription factor A
MFSLTKLLQTTKFFIGPRIAASCQIHSSNALSVSLEEKIGLPPRPKKPLTPFFRYLSENRTKLQTSNPQLKPIEVVKLCAKNYATVDPSVKTKYQDEYIKEQEEYIRKRTVYDNKLTDEQKYEIANAKQEGVEKKARIQYRKRLRENDKPKKPLSGFLRFLKVATEKYPRETNQQYRDWQKVVADKWNSMSDAERKPFNDAAQLEFVKYKQEITKWELKMVRLGNIDLVREEALIEHEISHKPKRRHSKRQSSDSD